MAYADYGYYMSSFSEREGSLSEGEFLRFERMAELELDQATMGRVSRLKELPSQVKDCACAIAEVLGNAARLSHDYTGQGLAGPLASWSNDGQSGSVDLTQSRYTESGVRKEIRRLCRLYLARTGLLYAGTNCYES